MPAAGLAAPQIGISKRVMIFSWDRSREHLHGAINPSFQPIDNQQNFGWEGCFSVPLMLAHVPRYQNIKATYMTVDGQIEAYILSGFAARVYQHECDHLDGIENIHKADAQTRKFDSHEEVISFITEVKKGDQAHYIQPRKISEEP
jgi:peptide deformylase